MTIERAAIWLVRHGETEWTVSGQHTGRTDIPLTPRGEHQARALGRHLAGRPFALDAKSHFFAQSRDVLETEAKCVMRHRIRAGR